MKEQINPIQILKDSRFIMINLSQFNIPSDVIFFDEDDNSIGEIRLSNMYVDILIRHVLDEYPKITIYDEKGNLIIPSTEKLLLDLEL